MLTGEPLVFCYSFKLDENGVEYTVRWDYNVGLVRMTDFFKALNHPKVRSPGANRIDPEHRSLIAKW